MRQKLNSGGELDDLIRQFIVNHFPLARQRSLVDDDSLLDNGIMDSLGILEVVEFIEKEFKVTLSDDEMLSDNFESIASLATLVRTKLNGEC